MNGASLDGQSIIVDRSRTYQLQDVDNLEGQSPLHPTSATVLADHLKEGTQPAIEPISITYDAPSEQNTDLESARQLPLGNETEFPPLPKPQTVKTTPASASSIKLESKSAGREVLNVLPEDVAAEPIADQQRSDSVTLIESTSPVTEVKQVALTSKEDESATDPSTAVSLASKETLNEDDLPSSAPLETIHKKSDSQGTTESSESKVSFVSEGFNVSRPGPSGDFPRIPFTVVPVKNPVRVGVLADEPTYHNDIGGHNGVWDGNGPSSNHSSSTASKKHLLSAAAEAAVETEESAIPTVSLPGSPPGTPIEQASDGPDGETLRKSVSPKVTEWLGKTDFTAEEETVVPPSVKPEVSLAPDHDKTTSMELTESAAVIATASDDPVMIVTSSEVPVTIDNASNPDHKSNATAFASITDTSMTSKALEPSQPPVLDSPNWPSLKPPSTSPEEDIEHPGDQAG